MGWDIHAGPMHRMRHPSRDYSWDGHSSRDHTRDGTCIQGPHITWDTHPWTTCGMGHVSRDHTSPVTPIPGPHVGWDMHAQGRLWSGICPQGLMGWEMPRPCPGHPVTPPSVQPLAVCFLCRRQGSMRCPSRCGQRGAGRCSHPSWAPPCPLAPGTGRAHLSQGDSSRALSGTDPGAGHPPATPNPPGPLWGLPESPCHPPPRSGLTGS